MGFFDFSAIRKARTDISARHRELDTQIEALRRQRQLIATAPAAKSDIAAEVRRWVRASAEVYAADIKAGLAPLIRSPHLLGTASDAAHQFSLFGAIAPGSMESADVRTMDRLLCGLFPDAVEKSLLRTVEEMAWPGAGLPMSERPGALAKIDAEIGHLSIEFNELTQAAEDAGISLE